MPTTNERATLPARTHADAAGLLRRPFAPGAICRRKARYNARAC